MDSIPRYMSFPQSFGGNFKICSLHFGDEAVVRCRRCPRAVKTPLICAVCVICVECHGKVEHEKAHTFERTKVSWSLLLKDYLNLAVTCREMDRVMNDVFVKINAVDAVSNLGIIHGLLKACDDAALLQSFLELGANAEAACVRVAYYRRCDSEGGDRPVHFATKYGRIKCLPVLLNAGVDLDTLPDKGSKAQGIDDKINPEIEKLLETAKPKNLAQLASEKLWYAVRYRMRTGRVHQVDLDDKHDGKTTAEWILHHMVNYEYKSDCEEWNEDLAPFRVLAELNYRYGDGGQASSAISRMILVDTTSGGNREEQDVQELVDSIREDQAQIKEQVQKAITSMLEGFSVLQADLGGAGR